MMSRTQRTAVVFAAGTFAALGVAGTAMAAAEPAPSAPPSAPPSVPASVPASAGTGAPSGSAPSGSAPSGSAASAATISADEARAIALEAVGGGEVVETERDDEDGKQVWEVEVRAGADEHDVDIDAVGGQVLSTESEVADQDDADADDDADAADRDDD